MVCLVKLFPSVQDVPSQVSDKAGPGSPPKHNAAVDEPAAILVDKASLPAFKLLTSVQEVPFQLSVPANTCPDGGGTSFPPIANAAVEAVPAPANCLRAVFKSATSVHVLPFHNSVNFV